MNRVDIIKNRITKTWELNSIQISHNVLEYHSFDKIKSENDSNCVRLHFGLQGSYDFSFSQLNSSFSLSGQHNNIMYSDGLEIEVQNKSKRIETFGINFNTKTFIEIGQNGNDYHKECEVWHYFKDELGRHCYSGWFHFKGNFIGEIRSKQIDHTSLTFELTTINNSFSLGFHFASSLTFFEDKEILVQIEFDAKTSWTIDKELESE